MNIRVFIQRQFRCWAEIDQITNYTVVPVLVFDLIIHCIEIYDYAMCAHAHACVCGLLSNMYVLLSCVFIF